MQAEGTPVGRRVVLGLLGLGALGVVGGRALDTAVSRLSTPLAGVPLARDLLPTSSWRYYNVAASLPYRSGQAYRLRVSGLVHTPLVLSLADLRALPRTALTSDFQCVTGWRVPQVHWAGVRVADLLAAAGVGPGARALRFTSFDGIYTESLTLAQAARADVLVADTMDTRPLSREHGGPVRLLVAPMYGYKSCKWLGGIEVVDRVEPGYWEQFGYDTDAWVGRSNGRQDAPTT